MGKSLRLWLTVFFILIGIYFWFFTDVFIGFFIGLTAMLVALALFFD